MFPMKTVDPVFYMQVKFTCAELVSADHILCGDEKGNLIGWKLDGMINQIKLTNMAVFCMAMHSTSSYMAVG